MLNKLLSSDAYTPVNKFLAIKLGFLCAGYFGELIRQRDRFGQNEFYFSQKKMEEEIGISHNEQRTCLKKLVEFGFISVEKKGLPAKYHFKIYDEQVLYFFKHQCYEKGSTGDLKNEAHSNNLFSNKENKEISTDVDIEADASGKKQPRQDITDFISEIKNVCNEMGIAYNKKNDRNFAKNILDAKEFGEFCEKVGQSRTEFSKNIVKASIKINFRKGPCGGPMDIYQFYVDVYNQTKLKNKKTQENSRVAIYPGLKIDGNTNQSL